MLFYGSIYKTPRKDMAYYPCTFRGYIYALFIYRFDAYYIIPPAPPAGIAGSGAGISTTAASVVSSVEATDTAF